MSVLRVGAMLVLVCLIPGPCRGNEDAFRVREEERNAVPLDFLFLSGDNEMEMLLGFEIMQFIHNEHMRCDIKTSKEDLKFSDKMEKMRRYYRQAQHTFSLPGFEKLSRENKKALELNFHNALKDIDINHLKRLSRLETSCEKRIEAFLSDKRKLMVDYISTLFKKDRKKFNQMRSNMSEYLDHLEHSLNFCIDYLNMNREAEHFENAGNLFSLCFGPEVFVMIHFIMDINDRADTISSQAAHLEHTVTNKVTGELPDDQEDDDEGIEFSGEDENLLSQQQTKIKATPTSQQTTYKATPTDPPTDIQSKPEIGIEIENVSEGGPVVTGKDDKAHQPPTSPPPDSEREQITTEWPAEKPTEPEKGFVQDLKSGIDELKGKTATEGSPTLTAEDVLKKFRDSLEPGPVIIESDKDTDLTPTTKSDQNSEVINKFLNELEPGPVIIEPNENPQDNTMQTLEVTPSINSRYQSKISEQSEDEYPGVDAGIKVEFDPQDGSEVLVFDDLTATETAPIEDESEMFKTYFFIYFFGTLGVLLSITIVVLIVLIVSVKLCKKSYYEKGEPLISDEKTISVIKRSGYVNPTYQFFDEDKDE